MTGTVEYTANSKEGNTQKGTLIDNGKTWDTEEAISNDRATQHAINKGILIKDLEKLQTFAINRALEYSNIISDFKNISLALDKLKERIDKTI